MIAYTYPITVIVFGILVVGAVSLVPWLDRVHKRLERDLDRSVEKCAKERAKKAHSDHLRDEVTKRLGLANRFF